MSIFKRPQRKYVKKAYRVRNWREYEAGLRNRGSPDRLDLAHRHKGRVLAQDGVHWYNTQRLLEPIGNVAPVLCQNSALLK